MESLFTILIFAAVYAFVIMEMWNRAAVALTGALLLIIVQIMSWEEAMDMVEWETIILLFSMMVLVGVVKHTGVFDYFAVRLAELVGGKAIPLLMVSGLFTAVGSAFLDNVTTVLLYTPILLTLTRRLDLPAFPFLVTTILSANIGGAATLVGDPPNIMIGQAVERFSFISFLSHLAPVVIVILLIVFFLLYMMFRSSLSGKESEKLYRSMDSPGEYLADHAFVVKASGTLLLTICSFLLHPFLPIDLTSLAMAGALLMLLVSHPYMETGKVFEKIEWETLFFFLGLFVLVGGLEKTGLLDRLALTVMETSKEDVALTSMAVLWSSGILSGLIDNIPFVAAMIPVVQEMADLGFDQIDVVWWSLALGACLGGNATLIGSSCNMVVAGIAANYRTPLPFLRYMKYGMLFTLLSLIIATVYVFFRYLQG
ncbi:ArsB/NhaD family transporter [Salimicrobium halophilum]|uniref:Na+/H+ antiporter NhaD n=1 Tax=Salimicrobium halophilum TaxID=86666 RepID=A0A1G8PMV6_9BACI|nr:ArsB/NhaD family transporter [Salimicrobium halophilum]SDI93170.1 Na+/H+ antiporter NhaD [Salimicrobium halophilum]